MIRGARAYSPEANSKSVDMDLDDREAGYHGGPSMAAKRLTAHVAPVPGRSMSPDTTRMDPRFGAGSARRVDDEESYLYGNAPPIKKEQRAFPEDRKYQISGGQGYEDYDRRRGSFENRQQFRPASDPYESKPLIRRPSSPSSGAYRGGDPGPRMDGSGEYNDIDAGRRAPRAPVQQENKNFSREMYPARGDSKLMRPGEQAPRVAVYEMNKIPKKVRDEEQSYEDEDTKLMKLRSDHAKIELRATQLKQLVERTVEKENELKRLNKGRALADNREFCDNKKLQLDAQKKYEESLRQQRELEVELNAILNAQAKRAAALNDTGDNSQDADSVPQHKQNTMFSTDYLDEQREDREEELDVAAKLEFFDGGDHWCEPCQDVFVDTVKSYLEHLHCDDHWKVCAIP